MANHHPSPTMMQMQHQQQAAQQQQSHQAPPPGVQASHYGPAHQIAAMNEAVWMQIGSFSELLRNPDEAMHAYERALSANQNSTQAMNAIGLLFKGREAFDKALEFFRAIVNLDQNNGEAWGNLGHCYLMTENLQKAYDAYQQALVHLRDPKDPMLWYGIAILYDRYGSYDYAEEAFSQVMQIQPDFEKANEIYFRLGIIYKQQTKFNQSLECFKYIVNSPPGPLTQEDIWFQIGHVHEQQKDIESAKSAYQRVLDHSPNHAKVLQQLGWLHHNESTAYDTQELAIKFLEKSVNADNQDAQSWYLLGRCYMLQHKYPKAYEAYQQAVYRDGKNPTFWCSIGVLYYQINQYRDALDAYSRAIRLNPYISEVWYDLGTLYESCNNQVNDALDAYARAAELDPTNPAIKSRLSLLRSGNASSGPPPAAPQDVHPQAYQAAGPAGPQWGGSTQQPAPTNGHPAPPPGEGWAGRLSSVNPPSNPYENRGDMVRGQVPPVQRQPSPPPQPQEQPQQLRPAYPEPRHGPPRHGPSPAPGGQQYAQPNSPVSTRSAPNPAQSLAPNPSWGGSIQASNAPPSSANSANPNPNGMAPFRPAQSPRSEGRPTHDARMSSPKSAYPQHQPPPLYHHSEAPQGPSESGPQHPAPPPTAPMAEGPSNSRPEERPASVGPKRMREWEDEPASKKPASDENRARLEDVRHRRVSTPPRDTYRRNSSEARRVEDQRRQEEQRHQADSYHPSEAAHHQQNHSLSQNHAHAIQQPQPPPPPPQPQTTPIHEKPNPLPPTPKEERPAVEAAPAPRPAAPSTEPERAARKVDVDEDYDDSGEDEKKAAIVANGSAPTSATTEAKTSTPASAGPNGAPPSVLKTE